MSEWKTLGKIEVITDTDNGYDRMGEVSGGFDGQWRDHISKYGHSELLETLMSMASEVLLCARELRQERESLNVDDVEPSNGRA